MAEVPSTQVAYHQGGFYEIVLALAMLAVLWPLRDRFRRPTTLLWTTVAAYSAARFVMFFWRSDTTGFAFGLNVAQVTSLALLAVALIGLWWARRSRPAGEPLAAAA